MAIQKRYQYWSNEGGKPVIQWTNWYNYCEDDSLLKVFQKKEKYQLMNSKLLNEFRIV